MNDINDFSNCIQTLVNNVNIDDIDVVDFEIDVIDKYKITGNNELMRRSRSEFI